MTDSYTGADPFGNPGTTELPIMNALSKSDIEYVLGIQEDVTTSMAAGYASICRYHAVAPISVRPASLIYMSCPSWPVRFCRVTARVLAG